MDCQELKIMFEGCKTPYYKHIFKPDVLLVNEIQKHNCILLSKEIRKSCNNLQKDIIIEKDKLINNQNEIYK